MKQIIIALLLLLILAQFATAELTKENLKEIEKLFDKQKKEIKDYMDIRTEVLGKEIKAIKDYIDIRTEVLDTRIKALDAKIDQEVKAINAKIAGLERAIKILQWMIGVLALFFAAGIIFPLVLQELRERKRASQNERIEKLEQQLADLREQKIVR